MLAPSLHEIEQSLSSLWLKESFRESFNKGESTVSPSIAAGLDKTGVELYATLLQYGQRARLIGFPPARGGRLSGQEPISMLNPSAGCRKGQVVERAIRGA